jgi:hypothetical protein
VDGMQIAEPKPDPDHAPECTSHKKKTQNKRNCKLFLSSRAIATCGTRSGEFSVECGVQSVDCSAGNVGWDSGWGVQGVKCKVWSKKCRVWSLEWGAKSAFYT